MPGSSRSLDLEHLVARGVVELLLGRFSDGESLGVDDVGQVPVVLVVEVHVGGHLGILGQRVGARSHHRPIHLFASNRRRHDFFQDRGEP